MPLSLFIPNFSPSLLVTSIKAVIRSILLSMGLDNVLIDFFAHAAAGAASVLVLIFLVGVGIPRRTSFRRIGR